MRLLKEKEKDLFWVEMTKEEAEELLENLINYEGFDRDLKKSLVEDFKKFIKK